MTLAHHNRSPLLIVATLAALLGTGFALSGCGFAVGAGASAGVAAAEERGIKNAANDKGTQISINEKMFRKEIDLFRKVDVTVVEGRVLLTGAVRSQDARDEAGRIAWTAGGVNEVINEIQITEGGDIADYARDSWITAQLRAKLVSDGKISDINYRIETVNAIIYLIGIAQTEEEIVRVTDHARTISGVRRVVSHVLVKNDPRRRPV